MKILMTVLTLLLCLFSIKAVYAADQESTHERVLRTGIIRCGYIDYPPHFIMDEKTGKMSGISYEIIEEMSRLLKLKVEWTKKSTYSEYVKDIVSGNVDAICSASWQIPADSRFIGYTIPTYYSAVGAYARSNDTRFAEDINAINDPSVRISYYNASISQIVAEQDFPKAQRIELKNVTDEAELLDEVVANRADITFLETYVGGKHIKDHKDNIKNISGYDPLRLYGNTFAIPINDVAFKSMLDSALLEMIYTGRVDKIIKKYEEVPGGIYRVAKPFYTPGE